MVSQQSTEGGGGSPAACRPHRVSSPGQVRPGLLQQGKIGQGQPEGEAWHGAEEGPQGRGRKATCQGCSHEQAGQLDKVAECAERALTWQNF